MHEGSLGAAVCGSDTGFALHGLRAPEQACLGFRGSRLVTAGCRHCDLVISLRAREGEQRRLSPGASSFPIFLTSYSRWIGAPVPSQLSLLSTHGTPGFPGIPPPSLRSSYCSAPPSLCPHLSGLPTRCSRALPGLPPRPWRALIPQGDRISGLWAPPLLTCSPLSSSALASWPFSNCGVSSGPEDWPTLCAAVHFALRSSGAPGAASAGVM